MNKSIYNLPSDDLELLIHVYGPTEIIPDLVKIIISYLKTFFPNDFKGKYHLTVDINKVSLYRPFGITTDGKYLYVCGTGND